MSTPSWINPNWNDDDIFSLSKPEIDIWKIRVASVLKCRWRTQVPTIAAYPWAEEVAGSPPICDALMKAKHKEFRDLLTKRPDDVSALPEWEQKLRAASKLSCVVNGCIVSWEANGTPWNPGQIGYFWSKFESGERVWDSSLERKAGGIDAMVEPDLQRFTLYLSSASSVMALVRAVLGHIVRTGSCPEPLAHAFKSIRVLWAFQASVEEIQNISIAENIEQHNRRRHSEMDNIFQVKQWMDTMRTTSPKVLDEKNRLDVVKFAMTLGDPLNPQSMPSWLSTLMKDRPNTQTNRIAAMKTDGVTKKWLDSQKAAIAHPDMKTYNTVQTRVRAVLGFHEFEEIHQTITAELGLRGHLHKAFPLTGTLLLDSNILTSDGFVTQAEKQNVPQWRDGAAGRLLQKAMVVVAKSRLFDFDLLDPICNSSKVLFVNGLAWTSFARICGPPNYHMDAILERTFGAKENWSDSVRAFRIAIWAGEHDPDISKLAALLPASLDSQPTQMQRRICETFPPLLAIIQQKDSEAHRLTMQQKNKEEERKKHEAEAAEEEKRNELPAAPDVHDGDVTEDLFKNADNAEKRKLCQTMNMDSKKRREAAMERDFHKAAAAVFRQRVVVCESVAAAKAYMESNSKDGIKSRVCYLDLTMLPNLQASGEWSKLLLKQPSKATQEDLARKVMGLPCTAITGSLLCRSSRARVDKLMDDLSCNFPARYEKTLFVPIDVPAKLARALKSAASRALGPDGDHQEKSGVELTLRSVGGRGSLSDDVLEDEDAPATAASAVPVVAADPEEEEVDADKEEEVFEETAIEGLPLDSLSRSQMRGLFGREALAVMGALFQHTSKICEQSRHLPKEECLQITKPNGRKALYRRSQMHPTVLFSAIRSTLACTASNVGPNEAFVQLTGGTPDGVVAAIMVGFTNIIYISNSPQEANAMKLPSTHEESLHSIDYTNYISPIPDDPEHGTMAAHAVGLLAPYIKNYVLETAGSIMVPSPIQINVPPLQTFTFIPITGRVIARTVQAGSTTVPAVPAVEDAAASSSSKAGSSKDEAKGGPGSKTGAKPPNPPKNKGKINDADANEDAEEGEDDAADDDDDDDEEGAGGDDLDDELDLLQQMEDSSTPKKPKGRGGGRGTPKSAGAPKKKPRKA